ncbi:19284_t:CDS:2, partial [Gigaspora margarita]
SVIEIGQENETENSDSSQRFKKWEYVYLITFNDKRKRSTNNCSGIVSENKDEILIEFKRQLYSVSINQLLGKKAHDKATKLHKNVEKNFKFKEVVAFFVQMDEKPCLLNNNDEIKRQRNQKDSIFELLTKETCKIREELEKKNLWNKVNEQIQYVKLNKRLVEFILEVQQNPFINIPKCENQSLFSNTKDLLWRIPEYIMQSSSINKSTWEHNILDSIIKYITYDLEDDIFIRYYEWEVLLREVSNGPFINTTQTQSHISDDHDKLGKCAKDALDDALNYFINRSAKTFKEVDTFLIHAQGTFLELFILDQEFEPFFRLRKLCNISIPCKQGTIGGIIDLVQNLQTFRDMCF